MATAVTVVFIIAMAIELEVPAPEAAYPTLISSDYWKGEQELLVTEIVQNPDQYYWSLMMRW